MPSVDLGGPSGCQPASNVKRNRCSKEGLPAEELERRAKKCAAHRARLVRLEEERKNAHAAEIAAAVTAAVTTAMGASHITSMHTDAAFIAAVAELLAIATRLSSMIRKRKE
jgi:hypothetical protein